MNKNFNPITLTNLMKKVGDNFIEADMACIELTGNRLKDEVSAGKVDQHALDLFMNIGNKIMAQRHRDTGKSLEDKFDKATS